jgi:hypothetical protein
MWIVDRLAQALASTRLVAFFGMVGRTGARPRARADRNRRPGRSPIGTYQGASFHAFVVAAASRGVQDPRRLLGRVAAGFDERMDGIVCTSRAGLALVRT